MTKYAQITSEAGRFSEPFIPVGKRGIHKMACCDCGLVHDMKFTAWAVVKGGYRKLSKQSAVVMIQAKRNGPATGGKRNKKSLRKK